MNSNAFKFALLLAAFIAIFFGMRTLQAAEEVDVQQAQAMLQQGAMLIDVREPAEYAAGHVPGARLMPLGQVETRMQEIADHKDKPIVVMCHSGRRSAQAAKILGKAGFTQAFSLNGGILAWQGAGLEVVSGAAPSAGK